MISLNKIAKINVFKVPNNYFDELPLSINQRVEIEEEPVLSLNKKQSFSTPQGYFENLSSKILSRIEQIEAKSIDLESFERVNIFKVPNAYFENLVERIQANVWLESLEKQNVFQVPDNYFQELELNTSIVRFDKVNVFKTPKGYFETLTEKILSKISTKKEAKVIKVNWFSTKVRWSAAASIVLMIGLWFAIPQLTKDKTELALEKVSNDDIKTYLETQDLSYLEYESAVENAKIPTKTLDVKALDGLKINKQEILEHLENQDLEEDI
jgi:hypothetical protein